MDGRGRGRGLLFGACTSIVETNGRKLCVDARPRSGLDMRVRCVRVMRVSCGTLFNVFEHAPRNRHIEFIMRGGGLGGDVWLENREFTKYTNVLQNNVLNRKLMGEEC